MTKGEIAWFEQDWQTYFQKFPAAGASESVYMWERVNTYTQKYRNL